MARLPPRGISIVASRWSVGLPALLEPELVRHPDLDRDRVKSVSVSVAEFLCDLR
jgi:hypothetical protein